MKYLIVSLVFIIGIVLGYVLGISNVVEKTKKLSVNNDAEPLVVYDTIIKTKRIEVPIPIRLDTLKGLDSSNQSEKLIEDSLLISVLEDTTIQMEDDFVIRREKLLKTIRIPIDFIGAIEEDKDTLLKEMMGIKEVKITEFQVEFWESPLNFSGYKLSKKKLVLYGLSPQFEYSILKNKDRLYLSYQDIYYVLNETQEFSPFKTVKKQIVFND